MVVDIDGTITRSEVRGYIETVYMRYYQYCHRGVVEFFCALQEKLRLQILFLTSRPIGHYEETKKLLNSLRNLNPDGSVVDEFDEGETKKLSLPLGPVFANKHAIVVAAYRELILRASQEYKTDALYSVSNIFQMAYQEEYALGSGLVFSGTRTNYFQQEDTKTGAPVRASGAEASIGHGQKFEAPFVLGFGNKVSDAKAYEANGVIPCCVFLIDKHSKLKVWSTSRTNSKFIRKFVQPETPSVQVMRRNDDLSPINTTMGANGLAGGSFPGSDEEDDNDELEDYSGDEAAADELKPTRSRSAVVNLYLSVVNSSSNNPRVTQPKNERVRVRFESYDDPILFDYVVEQMKLITVSKTPSASDTISRPAASRSVAPLTLPLYTKSRSGSITQITGYSSIPPPNSQGTVSGVMYADSDGEEDKNPRKQPDCLNTFCAPGVMMAFAGEDIQPLVSIPPSSSNRRSDSVTNS